MFEMKRVVDALVAALTERTREAARTSENGPALHTNMGPTIH
jgi:hypothetical protein